MHVSRRYAPSILTFWLVMCPVATALSDIRATRGNRELDVSQPEPRFRWVVPSHPDVRVRFEPMKQLMKDFKGIVPEMESNMTSFVYHAQTNILPVERLDSSEADQTFETVAQMIYLFFSRRLQAALDYGVAKVNQGITSFKSMTPVEIGSGMTRAKYYMTSGVDEALKHLSDFVEFPDDTSISSPLIMAGFLIVIILAITAQCCFPTALKEGRPSLWMMTMLLYGYIVLIVFGLFHAALRVSPYMTYTIDPHSDIAVQVSLTSVNRIDHPNFFNLVKAISSSSGYMLTGLLMVIFGICIPFVKLALNVTGEFYRFSEKESRVNLSRKCLGWANAISKWPCPIMFTYITIFYLPRAVKEKSAFIDNPIIFGLGFTGFSVFCISSVLSSYIVPPKWGSGSESDLILDDPSCLARYLGAKSSHCLIVLLELVFFTSFSLGAMMPMLNLRLQSMSSTRFLWAQKELSLTLYQCLVCVLKDGHANAVLAFLIFALFVFICPILDMISLLSASQTLHVTRPQTRVWLEPVRCARCSWFLNRLSMLDMALIGIAITHIGGGVWWPCNFEFRLEPGMIFLIIAEIIHQIVHTSVMEAVRHKVHQAMPSVESCDPKSLP